jgi:cytochrome c oxidase assembly protein subunit 11
MTPSEKETLKKGFMYGSSIFIFVFAGSWVFVPLYQLVCGVQGGGMARREGFVSHRPYVPDEMKVDSELKEKLGKRVIRVEFAASVQGRLRWQFEPEQKYLYVTPGETALAFFKAKNRSVFPVIGTSVYHMIPPEAGVYLNKIQCFCFDEQLLAPGEEIEMPVFFYIDPEIVKDKRFDGIDTMTLTYIFMEAPGAQIPDEYKELEQKLAAKVTPLAAVSAL